MTLSLAITYDPSDLSKGHSVVEIKSASKKRSFINVVSTQHYAGISGSPNSPQGFYVNPENFLTNPATQAQIDATAEQFLFANAEIADQASKRDNVIAEAETAYTTAVSEVYANLKAALTS